MEYVGIQPAPDCSLSSRRFSLFGILATSEDEASENETCHFCLTDVNRNERMVTETPDCGHLVHSARFVEMDLRQVYVIWGMAICVRV
jgi:hypothetical protein